MHGETINICVKFFTYLCKLLFFGFKFSGSNVLQQSYNKDCMFSSSMFHKLQMSQGKVKTLMEIRDLIFTNARRLRFTCHM